MNYLSYLSVLRVFLETTTMNKVHILNIRKADFLSKDLRDAVIKAAQDMDTTKSINYLREHLKRKIIQVLPNSDSNIITEVVRIEGSI